MMTTDKSVYDAQMQDLRQFLISSARFLFRWARRSLTAMVLLLLHATNLYTSRLRDWLPESWLTWSDDLVEVIDTGGLWLAAIIVLWALLYTFYEVDRHTRDPKISAKLKEFYCSGEKFELMTVNSDDDLKGYITEYHNWYANVRSWISDNMSQAAVSLFNDKRNILPITHSHQHNREHMSYINTMQKFRGSLQRLIESSEWDND